MDQDKTIKVLVLCQRYGGEKKFNKKDVEKIHKDIDQLISEYNNNDDTDVIIVDFLTKGFKDPKDRMTFNINLDYKDEESKEFVEKNKYQYSYIVVGQCPLFIWQHNEKNVEILWKLLKNKGKIVFSSSNSPLFEQWWGIISHNFERYFQLVNNEPKLILEKKEEEKKEYSFGSISSSFKNFTKKDIPFLKKIFRKRISKYLSQHSIHRKYIIKYGEDGTFINQTFDKYINIGTSYGNYLLFEKNNNLYLYIVYKSVYPSPYEESPFHPSHDFYPKLKEGYVIGPLFMYDRGDKKEEILKNINMISIMYINDYNYLKTLNFYKE